MQRVLKDNEIRRQFEILGAKFEQGFPTSSLASLDAITDFSIFQFNFFFSFSFSFFFIYLFFFFVVVVVDGGKTWVQLVVSSLLYIIINKKGDSHVDEVFDEIGVDFAFYLEFQVLH